MGKVALITGVTGQDGSYLAELLLEKGYAVHGIKRRSSAPNSGRIDHVSRLELHYGDMTDANALARLIKRIKPHEIYNLAAQSHVAVSFEEPAYTADCDAIGPLRILESLRVLGFEKSTRFYQASTSELFGKAQEVPQTERTPFYPRSPYGVAKLYGFWITVNYRESYGMFACNGVLFNHESPRRGEEFVTRKVTRALARIKLGLQDKLYLGNMDAKRDWGHARDFVEAQWLMLQQDEPVDYVIATGEQHSIRSFVEKSAQQVGLALKWSGAGPDEKAYDQRGKAIIEVDPKLFRAAEVESLIGDASKARRELGWEPKISFDELVREMVEADLALASREKLLLEHAAGRAC